MILSLVKRNLKVYFRDRASVFFSLLSVFIILGVYTLFLGRSLTIYTEHMVGENARFLMGSWIMAGVVAVTTITTANAAFGVMVEDEALKRLRDFKVSPIKRSHLVISYVFSAMIIGFMMSLLTFVIAEVYLYFDGGSFLGFLSILKVLLVILLSVFSGSALVFLISVFIKSQNAFATASSIIGTLIGFITGIYIPIGNLPTAVQTVIKIFPTSHSGVLIRQIMMEKALPIDLLPEDFKIFIGLNFEVDGQFLSEIVHFLYLLVSGVVFYLLAILIVSKKGNK